MEPTDAEQHLQKVAKLLSYTLAALGREVPPGVHAQAEDIYANDRTLEPTLCDVLHSLPADERDAIVYAKDRTARDLANWWEDHLIADANRATAELAAEREAALRRKGLAKLSTEERDALGLAPVGWDANGSPVVGE